ncbi:MAG: aldo/keto reductase [Bryobacterales bacterium]|nr:aldo/keto reductase [Bryobacterales bacterium]
MEYRFLGGSGLEVSVLSFGTMTLGGEGRFAAMGNVQVEEAKRHVGLCLDAGVNLFDTADMYSAGKSEEVLGKALGGRRKEIVLATKVFMRLEEGRNKNGLSRRHIVEACEDSLRRLGTDYIDLYQSHSFDSLTPLEETLGAFDDLVRAGKVRYIGCSNHSGWHLLKALGISDTRGISRYISQQINYSLIARDAEQELIPAGLDQKVGVMVWSPLQGGLLSGKFRRGEARPEQSRLNTLDAPGTIDEERLYRIVDALSEIASHRGVSIAQVALNWAVRKPCVDTVVIGARTEKQLSDNLAAAAWSLTDQDVEALDAVSAVPLNYPYWHQQKFAGDRNPALKHVR